MAAAAHRGHTARPSGGLAVARAICEYLNNTLLLCTVLRQPLLLQLLYYLKQLCTSSGYRSDCALFRTCKLLILYCAYILHT
jgi:hypothetical protein